MIRATRRGRKPSAAAGARLSVHFGRTSRLRGACCLRVRALVPGCSLEADARFRQIRGERRGVVSIRRRTVYVTLGGLFWLGGALGWTAVSAVAKPHDEDGWRDLRPIPDPPGAQQEHAVVA